MTSLGPAERLAAGAVGEPGDRTFFLEVGTADETRWFVLEKEQMAALARQTLEAIRRDGLEAGTAPVELTPPGDVTYRVGEMRVAYGDGRFEFVLMPAVPDDGEPVEFDADADVVAAMAQHALAVVAAGRPKCPRCGLAQDPGGHVCPASNGDLRRRR